MEVCGGVGKGDSRVEKWVQVEVEEFELEDSRSDSKDAQVLLDMCGIKYSIRADQTLL